MVKIGTFKIRFYKFFGEQTHKNLKIILTTLAVISALSIVNCRRSDVSPAFNPASFSVERMDRLFTVLAENDRAMGSVSIFMDGNEVYSNQIGYKDLGNGLNHDRNTEFRIGSISKTFLAAVIMQMVDEELLTLDSMLSDFFPEITNSGNISIKHMLQHRSGIFSYTDDETFPDWMHSLQSKTDLLQRIAGYESIFEPGTDESYSNSNFFILALIAEIIDGNTYDRIIERRTAEPLGLQNTHVGGTVNPIRNEALPYLFTGEWIQTETFHPSVLLGAGDIVSTPFDLNVFFNSLMSGNVVSENSLNEMKTAETVFGLGLVPVPFYDRIAFGHTGGMPGFQAVTVYFPLDMISVSYTTNGVRFPQNDILIGVLSIIYNEEYEIPVFRDAVVLPIEILDRYSGVYESPDLPLLISVFLENGNLMAQATGQGAFPLEAVDEFNFVFDAAFIHIEFLPETRSMVMTQAGQGYNYSLMAAE